METASEVLLLIVSGTLALFLMVGIVALVKIIQLVNKIKHVADTADSIGNILQKSAVSATAAKVVGNVLASFKRKSKKG